MRRLGSRRSLICRVHRLYDIERFLIGDNAKISLIVLVYPRSYPSVSSEGGLMKPRRSVKRI